MKQGSYRGLNMLLALCASLSLVACAADELMMVDDDAFTVLFNTDEFQACGGCHAPDAPGFQDGVEATQDWSTRDKAFNSLKGMASGLMGAQADCNGVPFLGSTAETSLLVATLDEDIRASFSLTDHPNCDVNTVTDMTLKIGGPLPAGVLSQLKDWVNDGAPNQ